MFNPQALAASWIDRMAACYPHVVEGWRTQAFPPRPGLLLLDRFIEGTMARLAGQDQTDPDRWGEAMQDVLETELGGPMPPDPREPPPEDPTHGALLRQTLRQLANHYFTADWEAETGTNGPP